MITGSIESVIFIEKTQTNSDNIKKKTGFGKLSSKKLEKYLKDGEVVSWITIIDCFQTIFSKLEAGLADDGLNVTRFQVLFYLYFNGNLNANALSKKLLVTRGNMSQLLKRMEVDGLISLESTIGKKSINLKITKDGTKLFETIFPKHIKRVKSLIIPLSQSTLNEIQNLKENAEHIKIK